MNQLTFKRSFAILSAMFLFFVTGCQRDGIDDLEATYNQPDVFHEITGDPQMREAENFFIDQEATLRKRYVTFDSAQMMAAVTSENDVRLNLFDDYELVAQTVKVDTRKGVHSWAATVDGANYSRINLSFAGEHVMGMVHVDDVIFSILPLGEGRHVIAEVVQSNFLDGDCDEILHVDHSEEHLEDLHSTNKVTSNTVRVMLVLPNDGMKVYCSNSLMKSILEVQAENSLNDAFNTSLYSTGYSADVVIVCSSYYPSKNSTTDLNWLKNDAGIASMRNVFNADLVCMFVSDLNSCGRGELPSNVSASTSHRCHTVVKFSCAFSNYSFPHEIGHNLGMSHDRYEEGGGVASRCSYGYVYAYFPGRSGRSIMAYDTWCDDNGGNCTREGRYSVGLAFYGRHCGYNSTGIGGSADNVSQLNSAFPHVTGYR